MKIELFDYEDLPDKYRAFVPYTKHFFAQGGRVTLVMVVTNPERAKLRPILDMFKTRSTDSAKGALYDNLNDEIHVIFWTEDAPK